MIDGIVLFKKFITFCLVGFSGLILDMGATSLLKEKIKINRYVANTTGFIVAVSFNYWLNSIWTFESQNEKIITKYFSFLFIALIGLALNNLILRFLSEKKKWNFYISKIVAIGGVTLWNFTMNLVFVFPQKI